MSEHLSALDQTTRHEGRRSCANTPRRILPGWLAAVPVAAALLLLQAPAAHALDCLPTSQPLVKIPEIVTQNGILRGTMVLTAERQRLIFRSPQVNGKAARPGNPSATYQCQEQIVRAFHTALPSSADAAALHDPLPGPTLRARVGDIVELTFINDV